MGDAYDIVRGAAGMGGTAAPPTPVFVSFAAAETHPKLKVPVKSKKKKKGEGVSREVAGLVGKNNVELMSMPIVPTALFKQKRLQTKAVKWEWKAFANSARPDGVMFYHWQKEGVAWDDYPFARFNKKIDILQYTDSDYEKYFLSTEWSKVETDKLMELCRQYDLRFLHVEDKLPFRKTMEEIKDRFYSIQRKLTELSGQPTDENPMFTHPYRRDYETERKFQLQKMFNRSREVEAEELALVEEAKKLKQIQKKREKERKRQGETKGKAEKSVKITPTQAELMKPGSVCLRSDLMRASIEVSPKTNIKIGLILDNLGCGHPLGSAATAPTFLNLQTTIANLIDWQKHLQKKKFEYEFLKGKKEQMLRRPVGPPVAAGKSKKSSDYSSSKKMKKEKN